MNKAAQDHHQPDKWSRSRERRLDRSSFLRSFDFFYNSFITIAVLGTRTRFHGHGSRVGWKCKGVVAW